jgi:hypothetical protein
MANETWRWASDYRCCPGCPPDISVIFDGNGLHYAGWCSDVSFGGGYSIGSQTIDEFLTRGPLDAKMPVPLIAEIRAHLTVEKTTHGRRHRADDLPKG